jgi:hypothetical protein
MFMDRCSSPTGVGIRLWAYYPVAGTISPTANLIGVRSEHTATLLSTGRVLITGGLDPNSNYLATAELYH